MEKKDLSYRFEINFGSGSGDDYVLSVVDIKRTDLIEPEDIEFHTPGIATSGLYFEPLLLYFFEKHYDPAFCYNEHLDLEEYEKGYFDGCKENFYSYDMIDEICKEIMALAEGIEKDIWNHDFEEVNESIKICFDAWKIDKAATQGSVEYSSFMHDVSSYLIRFEKALGEIMYRNPQSNLISVSGP